MESVEAQVIEKLGIRGIIGKGGMGLRTTEAMKKWGCVYYSYPGGAGALAATTITQVQSVHWLDLGMPEAAWEFEVQDFGPLIVTIDACGNNHYRKVDQNVKKNTDVIYQSL
jgi:fumarate hydratase subunit beta